MYWFLYDSSGNIKESHVNDTNEWTNLNGYAGAVSFPLTDSTAQDASTNSSLYLIQSNQLVKSPNYATLQLQQAKTVQEKAINSGLNSTLTGGFTSKTTGHTYVTTEYGESNMHGELTRFALDSTLSTVQFYTIDAGWLAHTPQQLQSAFLDGGKWKDAQYVQAQTLIGQVNTLANTPGTTVAQIQAITWTPATY